ncbi:hypothetical protein AVEN_169924-1 [Araneus ventricosus]|uniref:Uncharacterized protein n=1 Tax=Araneus ventricosus TaxID=182803 RepID=A0A4Y2EW08_ARAVE|nr:hypothetical protein AVEN_169924-1 [Araneus ventricosus]
MGMRRGLYAGSLFHWEYNNVGVDVAWLTDPSPMAGRTSFRREVAGENEKEKRIVRSVKKNIHRKFKDEMGLLVDSSKQGFGISNDGNTTRLLFSDPEIGSQIDGIDVQLIKMLKVILGKP